MKRTINFIGGMHRKNEEGAMLLSDFNIEFNGTSRDVVVNSDKILGVTGSVTMYGPSMDLHTISKINGEVVNLLSQWNVDCVRYLNPESNAIALPFPVNVEKFKPSIKDDIPMLYFKQRDQDILKDVFEFLIKKYNNIRFFHYEQGYNENDYLDACSKSPFCIWLGRHESQGFALQECLSSDTPILVIDVESMLDEIDRYGNRPWINGPFLKATAAPYFDKRCGIKTDVDNWEEDFDVFIENLEKYSPRSYVVEELSGEALSKKWLEHI